MESIDEKLNQIKSKVNFGNVKSVYILKKIFEYMEKKKFLEIIKCNKKLQARLKISIKDYTEYSQTYSSIEINLNIVNERLGNIKLIDTSNENKKFFHIYSENSNEEMEKTELNCSDEVGMVKIIIDHQVKSFESLFENCNYIKAIYFKKFFRTNITNMRSMFQRCSSLEELDLSNFNTDNVTDMSHMFEGCSSLKELNLSNFNTKNVINMNFMFYNCSSLEELNLSNFNTNMVIYMGNIFSNCSSLKELNISSFNTNNVETMSFMFDRCSSLKELNLSNFNTKNVTNMNGNVL